MSAVIRMGNTVAGIDAHPGNCIVVGKVHEAGDENAVANCYGELGLNCVNFAQTGADYNFGAIPPDTAVFFEKLGLMLCGTSIRGANAPKLFCGVAAIHPNDRLRAIQSPRPIVGLKGSTPPAPNPKAKTTAKGSAKSLKALDTEAAQPLAQDVQWGLNAIGALDTPYTGKGVRVCVIDTGLDVFHNDLAKVDAAHQRSFVGGSTVMGEHPGHGTRCAGIIGGKAAPRIGPRYSVAPDAELFFARVQGDDGIRIENMIAALGWAVEKGCAVVSISIGDDFRDTVFSSEAMEIAAAAALAAGTLIVAGAGNDSERPNPIRAVDHPANCSSIMAVAAVGQDLEVAPYSNAAPQPWKPCVDIAAPGTSRSSTFPNSYATATGTSIATPFVAGVAALYAEACPTVRGQALWDLLCAKAKKLPGQQARDVGAGLVQAPRKADKHLCDAAP